MMAGDPQSSPARETEQGPASAGSSEAAGGGEYSSAQWLVAWAVLLIVLVLLAQTNLGYLAIYYALVLMILFLIVTQYKWFAGVLAPFSSLRPGFAPGSATPEESVQGATPEASGSLLQ